MNDSRLSLSTRRFIRRTARKIANGDPHLAEELEQETTLVALQRRADSVHSIRPWLYSVCKHAMCKHLRRSSLAPQLIDSEPEHVGQDPLREVLEQEESAFLRSAIARLPRAQAEVVGLRYLEGLSAAEVADRIGAPLETVRTRARRGIANLRADLERSSYRGRRTGAWFLALGLERLRPRRRAPALVATACVAVLATVVLIPGGRTIPSTTPIGRTTASADPTPLAPTDVGHRNAIASIATLDLTVSKGIGDRWGDGVGVSIARAGSDWTQDVSILPGTPVTLDGIPPGSYVASIGGVEIDRRDIDPGRQSWTLAWGLGAEIEVVARDSDGRPAGDVEVWESNPSLDGPRVIGRTRSDGRTRVSVSSHESWVAARGQPGATSRGVLVGQPSVQTDGVLHLDLTQRPVAWIDVEIPDEPSFEDAAVRWSTTSHDFARSFDAGRGLLERPEWLPPWRDERGRYGFERRAKPWVVVVDDADGETLWNSEQIAPHGEVPASVVVGPPRTIRGRVVDRSGAPIAGYPLELCGAGCFVIVLDTAVSDADGRFALASRSETEGSTLHSRGVRFASLPPTGDVELDLGDVNAEVRPILRLTGEVVGLDAPVRVSVIPRWRAQIPASHLLATTPEPFETLEVDNRGRFELAFRRAKVVGLLVEAMDEDGTMYRLARSITPRDTETGSLRLDLSRAETTTVVGHVDADLLPCEGILVEEEFGLVARLSFDGRTGAFEARSVPAGRWRTVISDRSGRLHVSARPLRCGPGERNDFGDTDTSYGSLRVELPPGTETASLEVRPRLAAQPLVSRPIRPKEARRRWIDLELPAGDHDVTLNIGDSQLHATASVRGDVAANCRPSEDMVRLIVDGVRARAYRRTHSQLDIYEEGGTRLEHVDDADLRSLRTSSCWVICKRVPRIRIECTGGGPPLARSYDIHPTAGTVRLPPLTQLVADPPEEARDR